MMNKKCTRCQATKPTDNFPKNKRYRGGFASWCKQCHKERGAEWAKENRERLNAKAAQWRATNPEKQREISRKHHNKNKDARAKYNAAWGRVNKDKRRATAAKRKAAKLQATPAWADLKAISKIYKEALKKQATTGRRMHVDHIVPLQSDLVCGLHCEANLRIIPGEENEAKKNYWWPNGPDRIRKAYDQPDLFVEPPSKPIQEDMKI